MYENERLERELTEKFGECLVTSSDIRFLKSNGYSDEDIIYHTAMKKYQKREFVNYLYNWMDGKKLKISLDEAKDLNLKFNQLIPLINTRVDTSCDTTVNFECFPNDDPTIVIYIWDILVEVVRSIRIAMGKTSNIKDYREFYKLT